MANIISSSHLSKDPSAHFESKDIIAIAASRNRFIQKLCMCMGYAFRYHGLPFEKVKKTLRTLNREYKKRSTQLFTIEEAREIGHILGLLRIIDKLEAEYFLIPSQHIEKLERINTEIQTHINLIKHLCSTGLPNFFREYHTFFHFPL